MGKKILEFIKATFSDSNKVMLQNLVGVAAFLFIMFIAVANQFYDKKIAEFIFDGVFWIVIGSLGVGGAIEGIKSMKSKIDKNDEGENK